MAIIRLFVRSVSLFRCTRRLPVARAAVICRSTTTSSSHQQDGYVARNKKLGRPLSPHLKVLLENPDPVWILSFGHRFSGAALTTGVSAAAISYLAMGVSFPEVIRSLEGVAHQHPVLWTSCKFLVTLPFTYHLLNGTVRHLYWDTGRGFTMKYVNGAGYTVLIISIITSLALAFYTPTS